MDKRIIATILLSLFCVNPVLSIDMGNLQPVNPTDSSSSFNVLQKYSGYKKGILTKNAIQNQYSIAMNKFRQSNVQASYQDFQVLINNIEPNDYTYMFMSKEMASIGFFELSKQALSKVSDKNLSSLIEGDIANYYNISHNLNKKDQIYLAEVYSNIMYNDQSKEATSELMKQTSLLGSSDYANYLVALGSIKNSDIEQAQKFIDSAILMSPNNINYKRLKAEIYAQSDKPQLGIKYFNEIDRKNIKTTIFDDELTSSEQYILYKISKNDYIKKYHLAYYYYSEDELNKALRVLQTSISGKKNINKDVYALTAKVYYDMKEFEKAQDYALKSLAIDSSNSEMLNLLGNISARNKDYHMAESYYKKASSKDSSYIAQVNLGKIYELQGNIKKAKELYAKVLKISSKTYEAYYRMALLEKDREKIYIEKAIAINPNFKDAWIDLARIEIEHNSYDIASVYLNVAKYLDDNDCRYYYYRGLILKNKGLLAESKKSFEKSYLINPEFKPVKEELSI